MSRTAHVLAMNEAPPETASNDLLLAFAFIGTIGALILLVAWTNVSSLMVAAAVGRRHEIAVRLSLGASRARLLRQLVTESTLLALTGGALGLTFAWWTLAWMTRGIHGYDVTPDAGTFAFVFVLAVATGILFGVSPALHATRGSVSNALRDSGAGATGRSRLQRTFVAVQIMLSQPLLVLLGTMLAMIVADYRPLSLEMGGHVIAVGLRPLTNTGAPSQRVDAVDSLIPRIAERPEVVGAVAEASGFDIRGVVAPDRAVRTAHADSTPTVVHVEGTAPGWFALVDVPIILGRDVSLADTATADHRIVIGSDLARALWRNESPLGRQLASPPLRGLDQDSIAMTVIGVYDASRRLPGMNWNGQSARGSEPSRVYTAHGKHWQRDRILVRTRGPADPFLPVLQQFLRAKAPSLPVSSMSTLAQVDAAKYRETLRMTLLAGAAGCLALLVASLGLYGVVSLAVQQRKREIGIRIAVGAIPARVAGMFLASGVRVSLAALLLGLPLSVAGLRVGISQGLIIAPDVNTYVIGGVIAVVLLTVALAATWVPARRAARVDPATTLRVE
jgi:predicted permease